MRPLEMHLELSSHVWMYNRLREMLMREGMIGEDPSDDEIRQAVDSWLQMVAMAQRGERVPH
jgi:hypothetical protein